MDGTLINKVVLQSCSLVLGRHFDIRIGYHERFSKNIVVLYSGRHEQRKVSKKGKLLSVAAQAEMAGIRYSQLSSVTVCVALGSWIWYCCICPPLKSKSTARNK